jgi:pantothenate kinase-related protein Tda10
MTALIQHIPIAQTSPLQTQRAAVAIETKRQDMWVPSNLVLPQLVGRAKEVSFLIETVTAGNPTVVSIHGPAGIGKSALLARLEAELARRGMTC